MRLTRQLALYALLIGLFACQAERGDRGDRATRAPAQSAELRSETPAAEPPQAKASSSTSGSHINWGDEISWRSWDSALGLAQAEGKSICLVVYAEWCARCKELAPVFASPEVASAARGLVMVHQDHDAQPASLKEQLGAYGSYVPRVLFLTPDGKVRQDLTSGHPRYPYFYGPLVQDQLVANMHAASAR